MLLKAILASILSATLSLAGFAAYVAHRQPKENWLTFEDFSRLLRGEKIGPMDNLTLKEYVALSIKTKPGDPLGYHCDGPFCVPIDGNVSLSELLSGTWIMTANQLAEQGTTVMPGTRSTLKMSSDKASTGKRQIKLDGSTRQSLMDPEKRPMGMNAIE